MRDCVRDLNIPELAGKLAGRRCLVTGGTGMVGRNLVAALAAAGAQIHLTLFRRDAAPLRTSGEMKTHPCDLADARAVDEMFARVRPEHVFHLAAGRGNDRDALVRVNVHGACNLAGAALRFRPISLVAAGSSLEYGRHEAPISEATPLRPDSVFGASKAAASTMLLQAALGDGLPVSILRLFSVYGYWESAKRLIPAAMRAASTGEVLPMTPPGFRRDFVFVSDVVEALLLAAQCPIVKGEIVNIGSGTETTNEEAVALVEAVSGRKIDVLADAYRPHATDTGHWKANAQKAVNLLAWKPRHTLKEGLAKTWEWFRDSGRAAEVAGPTSGA